MVMWPAIGSDRLVRGVFFLSVQDRYSDVLIRQPHVGSESSPCNGDRDRQQDQQSPHGR